MLNKEQKTILKGFLTELENIEKSDNFGIDLLNYIQKSVEDSDNKIQTVGYIGYAISERLRSFEKCVDNYDTKSISGESFISMLDTMDTYQNIQEMLLVTALEAKLASVISQNRTPKYPPVCMN